MELEPVITVGKRTAATDVRVSREALRDAGVDLLAVRRGGMATYHGPGQLVVFPVVSIPSTVRSFLCAIGRALLTTCGGGSLGLTWRDDPMGLWAGERKLGSCGIHVSRGICHHGFAINVGPVSDHWSFLKPCGMAVDMTSLTQEGAAPISVRDLAASSASSIAAAIADLERH